ncbi:MAG: AraC family transcriptional regulator, partial [Alistipes sp.]|nr:AraC family transcriptional regulator [Alistipes sp.]MBQ5844193.1 AraC family transcriptional regulator [Alistipes sp.]
TNMTISEVGISCAFTNISHFIKLFKQRFHTTPAVLRKNIQNHS